MLFHVEQVGDLRAAPAVDALVIVAHHAEVAMLPRQRVHEPELSGVRVLVFVHHHVTILRAAGCSRNSRRVSKMRSSKSTALHVRKAVSWRERMCSAIAAALESPNSRT